MTPEEKWLMAVQQVQNVTNLLEGELSDVFVKHSSGRTTRRFVIEFTDEPGSDI